MKIKIISLISWLALLTSVQGSYCNSSSAESPLSAIEWLSDIYINIDKPKSKLNPSIEEPNEFSTVSPKVDKEKFVEKITKLDVGNIYDGILSTENYKELLLRVSNELPPSLLIFLYEILSVKSKSAGKDKNYNDLLLIRLNKLLEFGATNRAQSLLEELEINEKKAYETWFKIHLISLSQKEACDSILKMKTSIPHYRDRIFCLIQSGNAKVATLALSGAAALDLLSLEEEIILYNLLYLHNEPLQKSKKIVHSLTPMNYRVSKLIGASIEHLELPNAYHHSELKSNIPQNKKLLYAENLVRNGALSYQNLNQLYSDVILNLDDKASKRANLSKDLEASLSGAPSLKSLKKFVKLFDTLTDVGLEKFALRYYSKDLLKIVNEYPNSRKALNLLLRSADLKTLRNIRNIKKLDTIYQNIIFNIPIDDRTVSLSEKLIIALLQEDNIPSELDTIIRNGSSGEAILSTILMLQGPPSSEITNIEKGITFFNVLGFKDLAREILIYKLANNEIILK